MNNHPYPPDEPTQPAQPSPYYSPWRNNQGNGQREPLQPRRPYQHPDAQQPPWQEPARPAYPQPQPPYANGQNYGGAHQNDVPMYEPTKPISGDPRPVGPGRPPRRRRRKRGCAIGCLSVIVILVILSVFLINVWQKVMAFGSAISTQSPLSSQTNFMGGSQRINILLLGYGGGSHDGAYLTDSMVIMSLLPQSHHTTLISVPRDLWVQNPANSGNYTKLNAVYEVAAGYKNQNPVAGGSAIAQKVSLITGLQINYWMTINFNGFKDFIDAIGGVDVNVPDSFNACYPKNDDAAVDSSWIKVQFNQGLQHMDGATAIEFARAREPLEVCGMGTSENEAELTDFGRSRRQQLIMQAALTKLKQWQTWPHLFDAMNKLEGTLYSNLSLADLGEFALKMDLKDAHRVGLTNGNVLMDSTSSDGEYILIPQNGDWALIPAYIQKQIYN